MHISLINSLVVEPTDNCKYSRGHNYIYHYFKKCDSYYSLLSV